MTTEWIIFAPVALPLFGASINLTTKMMPEKAAPLVQRLTAFVSLGLSLFFLILQYPLVVGGRELAGIIGNWSGPLGIAWRLDALSWAATFLGFIILLLSWLYSLGKGPSSSTFSIVYLIQAAAVAAVLLTNDLFNLFVTLEILGITSYILIAMGKKEAAKLASLTYLLISGTAMIFFLMGVYGLYRLTGSLSLPVIAQNLTQGAGISPPVIVSISFIITSVIMRSALLPLYGWLPEAHAQAPHAVSAILSGIMVKTPLFAFTRIALTIPLAGQSGSLLSWAGSLAAVVGNVIAFSQTDIKRVLAYTTIAQIGFIVSAWGNAVSLGANHPRFYALITAALIYALIHALYKSQLFMGYGHLADALKERQLNAMRGGLERSLSFRTMFLFMLAGLFSLAGLPGLAGYSGKILLNQALDTELKSVLLFVSGVISVALAFKLTTPFWPRPRSSLSAEVGPQEPSLRFYSRIVIMVLGLGLILLGPGVDNLLGFFSTLWGRSVWGELKHPSFEEILKTVFNFLAGFGIFMLSQTQHAQRLLTLIRERPKSFEGLFAAFFMGTLLLTLFFWFQTSSPQQFR